MPRVVDGPYVPFRAFGSSLYQMYVTLLGRSRPTHASSSNPQTMLTLMTGPISSSQILPMPRARGTRRTTLWRYVCPI